MLETVRVSVACETVREADAEGDKLFDGVTSALAVCDVASVYESVDESVMLTQWKRT